MKPKFPRHARRLGLPVLIAFAVAFPAVSSATPSPSQTTTTARIGAQLFDLMEQKECGWASTEFADLLRANPRWIVARNADGETPLHVAARKGYEHEAFLLLHAGADVDARDKHGRTALHLVAPRANEDAWMIRDMLALKQAALDLADSDGFTPLMHAARAGNLRTVETLVWLGASLRPPTASVPTPMQLAINHGHSALVALLYEAPEEPRVTLKSPLGKLPPHLARAFTDAAAQKDYDLLGALIAEGVSIDTQDASDATALHRAVYRAHEDVVTFLLMLGASPNLVDARGNTPYMAASKWFGRSMDRMRAMLLLAGSDVQGPLDNNGFSPLGLAVRAGNEEAAQLLIWCGADPTAAIGEKGTPMRIACEAGSQRLIDLLRCNGVIESEYLDPVPQKRLEQYVKRGLIPQVEMIIVGGEVSLSVLTDSGRTLLVEAVHARNIGMAERLLSLGADPEQRCRDGSNLLHATTVWNYDEVNAFRQHLLDRKVKLDATDNKGLTALMKATRHGEDWVGLHQLVEAGADLSVRDPKGRTALDLALQSGRDGATRYLISVGAPHSGPATVAADL